MMVLIAGTGSGCGKTTITSGIIQSLVDRGLATAAFKCGPDYIDPMFYERITGAASGNLDPFFSDAETLRWSVREGSENADIAVIEGVMGYYDGIGFTSEASTYSVARATGAPVILVISCRGMGASIGAVLKGFLEWPEGAESCIRGVIFNNLSGRLYEKAARMAESLGVVPLGYLPRDEAVSLESRHLGLVTAAEVADLKEKMRAIAAHMQKTIDIEGIIRLAGEMPRAGGADSTAPPAHIRRALDAAQNSSLIKKAGAVNIAVARDAAFCFTYKENTDLLRRMGCDIKYFSPIADRTLPEGTDGIILSGGYPELHAAELSENTDMLKAIRNACADGIPVIAECGGFMYLHDTLEGADGICRDMAGVVHGRCFRTERLQRFGYTKLTAQSAGLLCEEGETLRAHEFHYWDSDSCGDGFFAEKPDRSKSWKCCVHTQSMYAGFPHLFFYEAPQAAVRFAETCARHRLGLQGHRQNR